MNTEHILESCLPEDISLSDDLLRGVKAIARFIGESERRTYYLCERAYLPCGRVGSTLVASKRALRAHFQKITSGVAA
jgi:hypothetical protein